MGQRRCRVVITGMGAMTPLGESVEEFWQGLVEGRSGIGPVTLCDSTPFPSRIAGEVVGFDPDNYIDRRQARRMARFSQLAVAAAQQAFDNARLDMTLEDPERVGVLLGNGNGGFPTTEEGVRVLVEKGGMRVSPFFMSMILPNMAASHVSRRFGAKGYNSTVITACAASTQSIGDAAEVIHRGAADVMITGGTEAGISQLGQAGFCTMRALSTRNEEPDKASRPFDAQRDGFVAAEGAAILILEDLHHALQRGAPILAEVLGYAASSDANDPVKPDEDGAGAARTILWALESAGISREEVDYINPHGTSTPLNDASETRAIKRAFGDQAYDIPISATKSMIGHALGGAGALEAVACVKTLLTGIIHPTINYEYPDPDCDLDYVPNQARRKEVRVVLTNSFGFGGQNACLVLGRYEESAPSLGQSLVSKADTPKHSQVRVMVVEDEPSFQQLVELVLSLDPRFEIVVSADSGEMALEELADAHPDLALLDFRLPGIDGLETARRTKELCPDIKIALVTAHTEEVLGKLAMEANVEEVIPKADFSLYRIYRLLEMTL